MSADELPSWRETTAKQSIVEFVAAVTDPDSPDFIPDTVDDRLPEIGLHGADMTRLERIEIADGMERGFLNKVACIEPAARGSR